LKDAGKLTQLDVDAKLGDIAAKTNGTLKRSACPVRTCSSNSRLLTRPGSRKSSCQRHSGEAFTASGRVTSSEKEINSSACTPSWQGRN
jgi:hypothetical protein